MSLFGAFRPSLVAQKYRGIGHEPRNAMIKNVHISRDQKRRQRARLRLVDDNIEMIRQSGVQFRALEAALKLPKEFEMRPIDKYSVFSGKMKYLSHKFRKPAHWVPNWTKTTHRLVPKGF